MTKNYRKLAKIGIIQGIIRPQIIVEYDNYRTNGIPAVFGYDSLEFLISYKVF